MMLLLSRCPLLHHHMLLPPFKAFLMGRCIFAPLRCIISVISLNLNWAICRSSFSLFLFLALSLQRAQQRKNKKKKVNKKRGRKLGEWRCLNYAALLVAVGAQWAIFFPTVFQVTRRSLWITVLHAKKLKFKSVFPETANSVKEVTTCKTGWRAVYFFQSNANYLFFFVCFLLTFLATLIKPHHWTSKNLLEWLYFFLYFFIYLVLAMNKSINTAMLSWFVSQCCSCSVFRTSYSKEAKQYLLLLLPPCFILSVSILVSMFVWTLALTALSFFSPQWTQHLASELCTDFWLWRGVGVWRGILAALQCSLIRRSNTLWNLQEMLEGRKVGG